ncbi:MAG: response regulator, partial [Bacteroidota bacterium]|nr:response regulator [Bacteroidota bacterium]
MKRILVVDDVADIRTLMQHVLRKSGYEVESIADGRQCIEKALSFKPDLIILDIMMPEVHGFDVLKMLKANDATRTMGVIICSAKGFKQEQELAIQLGANDFLPKPFDPRELIDITKKFFGQQSDETSSSAVKEVELFADAPYLPALDTSRPYFRFWGTRGSTPVAGERYARYGGNTPCFEAGWGDDRVIIDAGSGIRELGIHLMRDHLRPLHILIGHTHWDHIQGFPFFLPAYVPGEELFIYGASGFGKDLESVFRGQLDTDYFPIQLSDMKSKMKFIHLKENPVKIGKFSVFWE